MQDPKKLPKKYVQSGVLEIVSQNQVQIIRTLRINSGNVLPNQVEKK